MKSRFSVLVLGTALHRVAVAVVLVLVLETLPARAQDAPKPEAAGTAPVGSTASPGKLATDGPAPNGFAPAIAKLVYPSLVKVYGAGGFKGIPSFGTGVVVGEVKGAVAGEPEDVVCPLVATSWSIALTSESLHVITDSGQKLDAKLWKQDTRHGLALVKILSAVKLPALAFVDAAPQPGDLVYAVGNAFDDAAGDEKCAVVGGVVSAVAALDVRVGIEDGPALGEVIITDAPNNPGTQGGALVSRAGQLLGILGKLVESKSTNTQINYAVPVATLRPFLASALGGPAQPVSPAKARPPLVETGLRILDAHLTRSPPAYVERVVPGSPAEKAGVQVDDLVFKLDGRVVRSCRQLEDLLREHFPDDVVKLELKRGNKIVEVSLRLAARKEGS